MPQNEESKKEKRNFHHGEVFLMLLPVLLDRAVDLYSFFADPDPAVLLNADPDPA